MTGLLHPKKHFCGEITFLQQLAQVLNFDQKMRRGAQNKESPYEVKRSIGFGHQVTSLGPIKSVPPIDMNPISRTRRLKNNSQMISGGPDFLGHFGYE